MTVSLAVVSDVARPRQATVPIVDGTRPAAVVRGTIRVDQATGAVVVPHRWALTLALAVVVLVAALAVVVLVAALAVPEAVALVDANHFHHLFL